MRRLPQPAPAVNASWSLHHAQTYLYDSSPTGVAPERGGSQRDPPTTYDTAAARDAVDRWSKGASARRSLSITRATSDYDETALPFQADNTKGAESQTLSGGGRSLALFQRSEVAANSDKAPSYRLRRRTIPGLRTTASSGRLVSEC